MEALVVRDDGRVEATSGWAAQPSGSKNSPRTARCTGGMPPEPVTARLRDAGAEALETAIGRGHRTDPVLPRSGGPAGNASLTAWTGLVLLVLFLAELVTLLDVRGLISWHVALGALLVPPALLKTATTGWRIARYYAGSAAYRTAGPPPLALRLLGPLVVLSTLAVLGSGVALVLVGETSSRADHRPAARPAHRRHHAPPGAAS